MSIQKPPAEVRVAFDRLDTLDGLPTADHVALFEDMNRRLAEALADLDGSGPDSRGPADPTPAVPGPAASGPAGSVPVPAPGGERAARGGGQPAAGPPRPGPGMIRPVR